MRSVLPDAGRPRCLVLLRLRPMPGKLPRRHCSVKVQVPRAAARSTATAILIARHGARPQQDQAAAAAHIRRQQQQRTPAPAARQAQAPIQPANALGREASTLSEILFTVLSMAVLFLSIANFYCAPLIWALSLAIFVMFGAAAMITLSCALVRQPRDDIAANEPEA